MSQATASVHHPGPPGEPGIWMFVFGDLLVFALFFATFLAYRADAPSAYAAARDSLSVAAGTANTLALLTSSWLVAAAVKRARHGGLRGAKRLLGLAVLFGLAFVIGKVTEYAHSAGRGEGEMAEFYMFYFVFTGIHLVHVLIGLALLTLLANTLPHAGLSVSRLRLLESGGIYWHMVDLLWVVLFALFYLVR